MAGRRFFLAALAAASALLLFAAEDSFQRVERIVAVGDVHGDLEQFVAVLRDAGVINNRNRWSGVKTHLVQTGDLVDRGPQSRKVMDLLMELERQARRAGGRVHSLMGNHEAMNVYGDLRYVTPEDYEAYRTDNSDQVREAFKKENPAIGDIPLGWLEHRFSFGPNGAYGKWIRGKNVVVRINNMIFLHGGIGPKYAAMPLSQINEQAQKELDQTGPLDGTLITDSDGPLWYRGLAQDDETGLAAHVEQALKTHQVERIVIGHTPTKTGVVARFGGKVILIDVGLSKYYGGPPACLIVEQGRLFELNRGRKKPLPGS
ncbi:MAG: metallophosphoesterase [Acidobacteria bacterium]|nr:metallophosphoesterase [Acidobacteriota bacterium]